MDISEDSRIGRLEVIFAAAKKKFPMLDNKSYAEKFI
jgi:hypothetical protein